MPINVTHKPCTCVSPEAARMNAEVGSQNNERVRAFARTREKPMVVEAITERDR